MNDLGHKLERDLTSWPDPSQRTHRTHSRRFDPIPIESRVAWQGAAEHLGVPRAHGVGADRLGLPSKLLLVRRSAGISGKLQSGKVQRVNRLDFPWGRTPQQRVLRKSLDVVRVDAASRERLNQRLAIRKRIIRNEIKIGSDERA